MLKKIKDETDGAKRCLTGVQYIINVLRPDK